MSVDDIIAVQTYRKLVQRLLDRASELKQSSAIEPPITESDLGDVTREIDNEEQETLKNPGSQSNYAAVETAFREKFYHLLVRWKTLPFCITLIFGFLLTDTHVK